MGVARFAETLSRLNVFRGCGVNFFLLGWLSIACVCVDRRCYCAYAPSLRYVCVSFSARLEAHNVAQRCWSSAMVIL